MLAHRPHVGHRGERVGPHVLGVRAREADPADAVDGTDLPQQVGEERAQPRRLVAALARGQLQVTAVAVDVLAEQRHLGDTLRRPAPEPRRRPGRRGGSSPRHGRPARCRTRSCCRSRSGSSPRRCTTSPAGRGAPTGTSRDRRRPLRSRISVIGRSACSASRSSSAARWTLCVPITTSTYAGPFGHAFLVLLRQAAGHDDLTAVALALPRLQMTEVAVELVVGVLPDAARVEDDDVGVVLRLGAHEPVRLEQAGDPFGVVLVHLAPVGANEIAPRHGVRGYCPGRVRHPADRGRAASQPSGNVTRPSASFGMCGLWAISHRLPSGSAT